MKEDYSKQVLTDYEIKLFINNKLEFNKDFNQKFNKIKIDYGVTIPEGFKFFRIGQSIIDFNPNINDTQEGQSIKYGLYFSLLNYIPVNKPFNRNEINYYNILATLKNEIKLMPMSINSYFMKEYNNDCNQLKYIDALIDLINSSNLYYKDKIICLINDRFSTDVPLKCEGRNNHDYCLDIIFKVLGFDGWIRLDVNKEKYGDNYVIQPYSEIMLCNIDFIKENFNLVEYEQKLFEKNKKSYIKKTFDIDIDDENTFISDKYFFYNT